MRLSNQLSAIAASLFALAEIASAFPTTALAPSSHHRHADFHKKRSVTRKNLSELFKRDVPCQPGQVIGDPGDVVITINNNTPNQRQVEVVPGADVPAAYEGHINICPQSSITFYPGDDFHGNIADRLGDADPGQLRPIHGSMLEINVMPTAVWWDVSATRGFSPMLAGPLGGDLQGEADYLGKATAAWWTLDFQTRQDLNFNNWYISADGTGVTSLNMDAGEHYGPDSPQYNGVLDLLQVKAAINAYIARGTPWGTTEADKIADGFSKQFARGAGPQTSFVMNLV